MSSARSQFRDEFQSAARKSASPEEETFREAQVSARCGGDGASRVRGRAGGIDLRRCLQQRVGVLLCVPARPRRVLPRVFSSSVKQERARSPSADSRSAPLLSPAAPAFQMTRYYRYGELDTCDGRWAAIWACMDRSKRYVRLDRRRNISTARLVRVRSQNSTRATGDGPRSGRAWTGARGTSGSIEGEISPLRGLSECGRKLDTH
jgi:hypothetical protein